MSGVVATFTGMTHESDIDPDPSRSDSARWQADRAGLFRSLHQEPTVLVLPNVWDVASARLVELAGANAVATTSAGVAWSLGVADGGGLGRERAAQLVGRIVDAVGVPVSADIEAGYGDDDADLVASIDAILGAGAVGINLEDSGFDPLRPIADQAHRIEVVRRTADRGGVHLFINARTDTYLAQAGEPAGRFEETVRRAEAYLSAGADGVFVPGIGDLELISRLTAAIPAPVNILVGPGSPTIDQLAAVGVRRASAGSSIAQAMYGRTLRAATELLTSGTYTELEEHRDYQAMNSLLARRTVTRR